MFQLKVQLKGATDSRMRGDESAIMTYYNEICNKNESFEETNDEQTLCNDFGPWVWANGIQYFHDYNKRLVGLLSKRGVSFGWSFGPLSA